MQRRRTIWRRFPATALTVAGLTLGSASSALADTTIGQTGGTTACAGGFVAADQSYVVPVGGGTITSFSYADDGNNAGAQLDFEVLRPNPDASYTIIGHTGPRTLGNVRGVETFPADIPVSGGEVLGFYESGTDNCLRIGTLDTVPAQHTGSDPTPGTTLYWMNLSPVQGGSLNESATLGPPGPAGLKADGATLQSTEGQPLSGEMATFTDSDGQPVGDYSATIDWGDGSSSAGTITETSPGEYAVDGSHTYAEAGDYAAGIQITDRDGTFTQASSAAVVADAALAATGLGSVASPVSTTPSFSGEVASLTDANLLGSVADLTATIDWGDGTTSPGTVGGNAGSYTVAGSHSYSADGPHAVQVHIADTGGNAADATTSLLVYEYADQTGGTFVIGDKGDGSSYFWGAQWASQNPLSAGQAPRAFKGFGRAKSVSCGAIFTARPGNSAAPPATVPAYMAVAVTGNVSKAGSTITGTVEKVVVLHTDPRYGADPGSPGTGHVLATICG